MEILQAIILGIIQGLTEFIPVSSSGHLVIAHDFLGLQVEDSLTFDVALHLGTLLSLLIYFRNELVELFWGLLGKNDKQRLAWLIALATVPAVVVGVLFETLIDTYLRDTLVVVAMLAIVGVLMLVAEHVAKKHKNKGLESITPRKAGLIGIAQACALIPGVSRSGGTITAGLFLGLDRVSATKFSFLMAVPVIAGASLKVMIDGGYESFASSTDIFVAGMVAAFLSGLLAIAFLMRYLARNSLAVFAYYRIALAGVLLITILGR